MSPSPLVSPRIDVLIPAYNVESTIVSAVESMLNQTFADIRVVVVDDGSTDGTEARLAELQARDPRVVVHRQPNGGIVDALNNGLALCDAEFIARHDGDDIAFPERLEKQLAYLDAHPDCIAVGANAFHIDETGRRIGSVTSMPDPSRAAVEEIPAEEPYLMHPLLLIRRQSLVEIGGYRYVFHAEDADLYWRLRSLGRLHNMKDILLEYRIHPNSISGRSILNGRIQAVNSQLAAVSERRRLAGLPDLTFPRARLARFHEAVTMKPIMAIAEEELQPSELPLFRISVAAKLLELESYRPYGLDEEDRSFVKSAFAAHSNLLSPFSVRFLGKRQAKYVVKRLVRADFHAAAGIMRPSLVPPVLVFVYEFVRWHVQNRFKARAP